MPQSGTQISPMLLLASLFLSYATYAIDCYANYSYAIA